MDVDNKVQVHKEVGNSTLAPAPVHLATACLTQYMYITSIFTSEPWPCTLHPMSGPAPSANEGDSQAGGGGGKGGRRKGKSGEAKAGGRGGERGGAQRAQHTCQAHHVWRGHQSREEHYQHMKSSVIFNFYPMSTACHGL